MKLNPNPLCLKMVDIYKSKTKDGGKVIICNEGGSRCFSADTKIITYSGIRLISELKIGNKVVSYNISEKKREYKTITNIIITPQNKKPCYKIKLKNGAEINCTQDHKFYFNGGWHEAKNIIHLWDERNTKL